MTSTPVITTDRLVLRRPVRDDWEAVRSFYASERSAPLGGPATEGAAWRIFAAHLGHWDIRGYGMWAVTAKDEEDQKALGLIGPWYPADWPETEVGWVILDSAHEGRGYAAEAARAAIDDAYTRLGFDTVVSYINTTNTRSIALVERLGAHHDIEAPQIPGKPPHLVYRHPRPAA